MSGAGQFAGISLAELLDSVRERDPAIDASAALFVLESVCAILDDASQAGEEAGEEAGVRGDGMAAKILLSTEGVVTLSRAAGEDVRSLGGVIAELADLVAAGPLRDGLKRVAARAERLGDAKALAGELELLRRALAVPRGAGELAERVRGVQRVRVRRARAADRLPSRAQARATWVVLVLIVSAAIWVVKLVLRASE